MLRAKNAKVDGHYVHIEVEDGRILLMPLRWIKQLSEAALEELQKFEIIGQGTMIEWENLDVHLDVEELFKAERKAVAA